MADLHRDVAESFLVEASRGRVPPLLWVYGEDQGRITRFLNELRRILVPEQLRPFNEVSVDCKEVGLEKVLELSLDLPMIGGRRLILVSNASEFPTRAWESFAGLLQRSSSGACIAFKAERPPPEPIVKIMKERGIILEFRPRSEMAAVSWVRTRIAREGKTIAVEAARALVALVGTSEGPLEGEIQKLLCLTGERDNINEEDVQEACFGIRTRALYELTNAIGESKRTDALRTLQALLRQGVNPLALVAVLAKHLRQLCGVLDPRGQGTTPSHPKQQVSEYAWERLLREARRWPEERLLEALRWLAHIDKLSKSGRMEPSWLLERWIIEFTR